ncbi:MAG: efflux RND transporter periplasmic adaptor subunit [Chitinophagales bacterium]|nr:efflux RND transporter periplasmic adaptor subunit [Chitinophagales bacterium]
MRSYTIFLLAFLISSCKDKKEIFTPRLQSITQSVYASGTIKSENQYQVFPKSTGIISDLYVSEGSLVNQGTILMKIENEVLAYNQELSEVNAKYNSQVNNRDKLDELYQSLILSEKKLKSDSLLFVRQKKLWQEGIGSQFDFEQKELLYENSKTNYRALRLRYQQLVKQINLLEKQTNFAFKISNTQSNDRLVKSQINGKVYGLFKEKGEMVSPQTPIALLGSENEFYLELNIDETDITKIKLGQVVLVNLESYEDKSYEASVTKIYPLMNERTKTFTVIAHFTKKPPVLYPNLSLEANILISKKDKALLIPVEYINNQNEVVLKSGEVRIVKTGLKNFEMVEILEGLKENEEIIKPEK